jgi:ribose transport system permease protein
LSCNTLSGAVLAISGGSSAPQTPTTIANFAIGRTLGVPNLVLIAAVVFSVLAVLGSHTVHGRRLPETRFQTTTLFGQ